MTASDITAEFARVRALPAGDREAWRSRVHELRARGLSLADAIRAARRHALNPRSWDMWAHDRGSRYDNPGEKWWVEIHGLPDPVVPVTVTEIAPDAPDATHWGWIDSPGSASRLAGTPRMIWASRAAFGAQFPYGVAAEVAAGKGHVVRLRITAREAAEQEQQS